MTPTSQDMNWTLWNLFILEDINVFHIFFSFWGFTCPPFILSLSHMWTEIYLTRSCSALAMKNGEHLRVIPAENEGSDFCSSPSASALSALQLRQEETFTAIHQQAVNKIKGPFLSFCRHAKLRHKSKWSKDKCSQQVMQL